MIYYLDTSALVKYYLEEEGTALARKAIDEADQLFTSALTELEFISCIERSKKGRRINSPNYRNILSNFERNIHLEDIGISAISREILKEGKRMIRLHSLKAADSIQLATAAACHKRFSGNLQFLCFDKALLEAARMEGIKCVPL